MRISSVAFSAVISLAQPSFADTPAAILVLDGSGSMWGQIDGTAKITIAQKVVGDLLKDLPAEQSVGLSAYGHRRKGDCGDIETLALPGTQSRSEIGALVNAIKPKGKTPMTDAVIAAAKALAYTEQAATVILVSDGIETCAPDPCAAARALEEAGVDFTAHVVGFDVDDADAIRQMQCLASETGGRFMTARDADELGEALRHVSAPAPEPEAAPESLPALKIIGPVEAPAGTVQTYAFEGETGEEDFLAIYASDGTQMVYRTVRARSEMEIQLPKAAGTYEMRYEFKGRSDSVLASLALSLGESGPTLTINGALNAGSQIQVAWTGPGTDSDFLSIGDVGGDAGYHTASDYLVSGGNPIALMLPKEPGTYELRYVYGENREHIVKQPIEVK